MDSTKGSGSMFKSFFPAGFNCQGIPNKDPTVQLDGAIPAK